MTASSRDLLARRTALVAARAEFGKRADELAEAMADAEAQGITRAAIARGTGLSRSRVSQILGPRVSAVPAHTPNRIVPLRGRGGPTHGGGWVSPLDESVVWPEDAA